jgi:hypothetical protein
MYCRSSSSDMPIWIMRRRARDHAR